MKIGFVGLGKMGKNMVLRLLEQGVTVVVWNRSKDDVEEVARAGAIPGVTFKELVGRLEEPRIIWVMVPSGSVVKEMIDKLIPHLSPGDLIVDGGNSFYKDTLRRAKVLAKKKIHFMDVGVSGGPSGARNGACLMVGGSREDYQRMEPILKMLSAPEALAHLGPVAAGHFAKMVHNGIEYGMMEAIAEGAAVLQQSKSEFKFDLAKVFELYNHRSVIESRLVNWTAEALAEDESLSAILPSIAATGEGEWTIKTAGEEKVAVPAISAAFRVRQESDKVSENSSEGFRNKVVSAMRGKFGGHEVKKISS